MSDRCDLRVYIDDIAPDPALNEVLLAPFDVEFLREKNAPGNFSFKLLARDPQVAKLRARTRIVIMHAPSNIPVASGRITSTTDVEVDPDSSTWAVAYEGEGDLADLHTVKIRPWGPLIGERRYDLAKRPVDTQRRIGWRDPIFDEAVTLGLSGGTWTDAVELFQASSQTGPPTGRSGHPVGFPDDAWWIWSEAIGGDGLHPQGDVWLHHQFSVDPGVNGLVFYFAGDDAYEVWWNGIPIAATANNETDDAFLKTKRVVVSVPGSTLGPDHHLHVRCRNEGPNTFGDIGGFLCLVRAKGTDTIITHTNSTWKACGYPAAELGVPVTMGLRKFWQEVVDRDSSETEYSPTTYMTWAITNSADSNSNPVPLVADAPIAEGASFLELLNSLRDVYIDFDVPPQVSSPEVRIYAAAGAPVIGGGTGVGMGRTTDIEVRKGVNATRVAKTTSSSGAESDTYANCILYRSRFGWGEIKNIPANTPRVEHFISLGDDLSEAEVQSRVARLLEVKRADAVSFDVDFVPSTGQIPGVDFTVGDRLNVVHRGDTFTLPVVSIAGRMDNASGAYRATLEVGVSREIDERRYEAWLQRSAKGQTFDQASPGREGEIEVTFIDPERFTFTLGVADSEPTDGATSNQDDIEKAGRVGLITMQSHNNAATGTATFQLYINGVAVESCSVTAGDYTGSAYFASGTQAGPGSKIRGEMTTWGGLTDITVTVTMFEIV